MLERTKRTNLLMMSLSPGRSTVGGIVHGLQPFVARALSGNLHGEMLEPAAGRGSVPVLDSGGDVYRVALADALSGLAPLLIVSFARSDDEDLAAAFLRMVDVPVVAAAGLSVQQERPAS